MTAAPRIRPAMTARRAILVVLAAALALSGCATSTADEHAGHDDAPEAADGARRVEVAASSFAFDPDGLELEAGEEVALILTAADITHDLVIDEVGFHLEAEPGEQAEGGLRIDAPGTYTAYCSVTGHREAGMETTVTVTEQRRRHR